MRDKNYAVVISAGGKGTRLASTYESIPKAIVPIFEEPIIVNQLKKLIAQGYREFYFLLGHLHEQVTEVIKRFFTNLETHVDYMLLVEDEPLGSGGALIKHLKTLPEEFLFLYCDIYFDCCFLNFYKAHISSSADVTLLVHPNDHPSDSDLLRVDQNFRAQELISHPHDENSFSGNLVNSAIYYIKRRCLEDLLFEVSKLDFAQDILPRLIGESKYYVNCYKTAEFAKDMGTPQRIKSIEKNYQNRVKRGQPSPVVYLDRDGTINKIVSGQYITEPNQVHLIEGVAGAMKSIREKGYSLVLITNQPVVARGDVSLQTLKKIHDRLEYLLGCEGVYLDDIRFCPHHPDKGFAGEVAELKFDCKCRKPGTGLFQDSSKYIFPDKSKSWMIGDSLCDVEAGINYGLNAALVYNENGNVDADISRFKSLQNFADQLAIIN